MREEFVAIQDADRCKRDHHHATATFAQTPSPQVRTSGKCTVYGRSLSLPFFEIAQQLGGTLVARAGNRAPGICLQVAESSARNRLIMSGDRQRAFPAYA